MNPRKVKRNRVVELTDLPNIGPSIAEDLRTIDVRGPKDLIGRDPYVMYETLCEATGTRHDPCLLDVFISITRFMDGEDPRPWWAFTPERKRRLALKALSPKP